MEKHFIQCDGPGCQWAIDLLNLGESDKKMALHDWFELDRAEWKFHFHSIECLESWQKKMREEHDKKEAGR